MNEDININPYLKKFAISNLIALFSIAGITTILKVGGGSGTTIAALAGSIAYTAISFVNENSRIPSASEKARLVWCSLLISYAISFVLVVIFLIISGTWSSIILLLSNKPLLFIGVFCVITVIYYLATNFFYGWFSKLAYKKFQNKTT